MTFFVKLSWDPRFSPLKNSEAVKAEMSFNRADDDSSSPPPKRPRSGTDLCVGCWTAPQVNWDGKLLGCCVNVWADFGNVFDAGLMECLGGEKYRAMKKALLGIAPVSPDIPCSRCSIYTRRLLTRHKVSLALAMLKRRIGKTGKGGDAPSGCAIGRPSDAGSPGGDVRG
jgi:hypothetical protein